jgi:hypothetical protein
MISLHSDCINVIAGLNSHQIGAGFGFLLLDDVGYGDHSGSTVEVSLMGLGERGEPKLVRGSEKRGGIERVEERLVVIGSGGGGGVEREGLHELGCGRERHYCFLSATSWDLFGSREMEGKRMEKVSEESGREEKNKKGSEGSKGAEETREGSVEITAWSVGKDFCFIFFFSFFEDEKKKKKKKQ